MTKQRKIFVKKTMARIFAFLLALLMVVLMVPVVSNAAVYELGSATTGIEILGGTPDPNTFEQVGLYRFRVNVETGSMQPILTRCAPGENDYSPVDAAFAGTRITYGGLRMQHPDGEEDGWINGYSFTVSVVRAAGSGSDQEAGVTLLTDTGTVITKGRSFNLQFKVVDYNNTGSSVTSPTLASYQSSAFPLQGGKTGSVTKIEDTNGLATFELTLPVRYSGSGDALAFTLSFLVNGVPETISGTYNIPNVKEYVEENDDDEEEEEEIEPEPLTPYIIVESYSYGGSSVTAGEDFQLRMVLRNTSETHSLQNIVMNVSPMGVFSITSSSNTIYIDNLFAGSTIEQIVTIKAGLTKVTDDEDANSIDIKFDFQYLVEADSQMVRRSSSSSERITIPVDFPDRFEISPPEMSSYNYAGEESYIYAPMVNKGRSSVYNLTASIRGETLANPGQMQYIGNLSAGSESGAEFTIRFDEPGEHSGEIVVTYEDANMNPKEAVLPFTVTVQAMDFGPMEPMFPEEPMLPEEPAEPVEAEEEKTDSGKIAVTVVAIAVCAMSCYSTVQKAKAKRSIFIDEDI